jgi:hypothetical protein
MRPRAVLGGLFAVAGGFSGVLAMWLSRGHSDGALAEGAGVGVFAFFWFLPTLFALAHLFTGHTGLRWPLLAVAVLQMLFGLLSFAGFFLLPGLFALAASWLAFAETSRPRAI